MSTNSQMHGKTFENFMKTSNRFSHSAADKKRFPNDMFDISREDDVRNNYPTSVKSIGSKTVPLSDARNFWKTFEEAPYRIIIGKYHQVSDVKEFREIYEFTLNKDDCPVFFGRVSIEEIREFHDGIGLLNFPKGKHAEARIWADIFLAGLRSRLGIIILNRKIDSKSQRRLQCSVRLDDMINTFYLNHEKHTENFGDLVLPIKIKSKRRRFSK